MVGGCNHQKAFKSLKIEIAKAPFLCHFDLNTRHLVLADASKDAIDAVLLQLDTVKDCWQPVEYASRKMADTEKRYTMVEKEALAVT